MKKKIAIIGAGGFGQEVFCIWRDQLIYDRIEYDFIGFFDDSSTIKSNIYGNVIGSVDDLNLINFEIDVAIAIGSPEILKMIRNKITNPLVRFPNIINPSVVFLDNKTTIFGQGNIVSLGVIFSCNVTVGDFNVFNTRVTIGHDVEVGSFNVFSPNVQVSGSVRIENSNFFGFNCGIIQKKKIGNNNIIGAGAIVLRVIADNGTYFGTPAIKIKI